SQGGGNISAIARDAAGNIYATGSTSAYSSGSGNIFPATPGAFQPAPQPAIPNLPAQQGAGGQSDAFVMKWDSSLSTLLAATLLGGELVDLGESIAVDSSGNVIVSGASDSRAFPTRAFFQTTFSSRAGFVAGLDSTLSHLLFSTYLGDGRPFEARVVVPDGNGNILLAGATLSPSSLFIGGDPGLSYTVGSLVVANKIALPPAPAARLDSIVNFASRFGGPVAPGEAILATGSGFGSDAQLLIDGASVPVVSITATSLVAMMPEDANTSGGHQIQVSTGGSISNRVLVPAAPAVPGLFSVDGSGYGQGFILNSDGTMNSPDNPAASGSAITIFATGVGKVSFVAPYAVTALPPSVFIDGFYADGIAATFGPVTGIPGNVYQLGIYVPDPATRAAANPNLLNFKMPPRVGVKLIFGAVNTSNSDNSDIISQPGLVLNVKQ
ncbi:MAG TPA: IPT/TIG domain-containing protein, partial [Bryobacteraceae bacterium]|nr:IPT/TIG domain-containing protein [Bryobacteraceae bacterium]